MDPEEIQKLKNEVEAKFYEKMIELMLMENTYDGLDKFNQMKVYGLILKMSKLENRFIC